jgi:hypothetical protein
MSSKHLKSSFFSYTQVAPGLYSKDFTDLTGVFLTTPDHKPNQVGLAANTTPEFYIDLKLSSSVPLLELEEGILMIPLPHRTRDWVADYYRRYKSGEKLSKDDEAMCKRIEAKGGIPPEYEIPVEIVEHGKFGPN